MKQKIFAVGGDVRLLHACKSLAAKGYDVGISSCVKSDEVKREALYEGINNAEIILLGVPVSRDGVTLYAPFSEETILLRKIAGAVGDKKTVIGGGITHGIFSCPTEDYLKRDEFAVLNAVPTAEGVLEIAMRETDFTVFKSRCLIIGFGKTGKVLCKLFSDVGAHVTAASRKESDMAMSRVFGYESIRTDMISEALHDFDIIINTVPSCILGKSELAKIRKDALIIDVASKPGGVDFASAAERSLNVIWALSLPGKVAPQTAGEIISEITVGILKEKNLKRKDEI